MSQSGFGDDLDRDALEAGVAGGDGLGTATERAAAPGPCRCRDCLLAMRTLRRDAIGRRPPVLPAGEGSYRLASWWSDGGRLDL